ncbi:iron-containing alcohol dehydrogenase [Pseudoalteromonas 'SMAR']|uniref:iron-containing alcohol dehydrogenase n=1 Tax=Pseudoalteromonas 'SMAR' TaxID=3416908 RepID=UPI003AF2269F
MTWLYRIYHWLLKMIVIVVGIPNPQLYRGRKGLALAIANLGLSHGDKVLVVTDEVLMRLALHKVVDEALQHGNLNAVYFNQVLPNPTIDNVESGLSVYQQHHCRAIIALGGGSVMDCAKLIGARVVKPNKSVKQLKGLFKVIKRLPANIAIPTTAGTGSETTVAAVVNDPDVAEKYAATDFCLVPHHAVLLPELTLSMPAQIKATTAIDALTHAIEALLSINCLSFSRARALSACQAIFTYLPKAMTDSQDEHAAEELLLASHYAGQAFTRTSVGYVHAISHQLSAQYGTPHGLANAVLLLPVLHWYGDAIHPTLAAIADHCHIGSTNAPQRQRAEALLAHIDTLLTELKIVRTLPEIQPQDVTLLAQHALNEAHPDYPVPKFMNLSQCQTIIAGIASGDDGLSANT